MSGPVVEVRGLGIGFTGASGRALPILRDIDLTVAEGETLGLVGESGSGKSTLALAMMGYLKQGLRVTGGSVAFRSHDNFALSPRELERVRGGELALIPQNAGQSLTPTMRVGAQIAETLRLHSGVPAERRTARVVELLGQVRLPDPAALAQRYPHELSGGQQQRVAVAMALAGEPHALLLDEPTTGLDVTTQAHILALLRDLARETRTAMVYVSHDLGAIASNPAVVLADEPTANVDSETAEKLLDIMEKLNRDRGITFLFSTHDPRYAHMADRSIHLFDGQVVTEDVAKMHMLDESGFDVAR